MIIDQHELSGLTLFESVYPPLSRQPVHTHTFASMSFILAGNYLERTGRQERTRRPSTLVFHPADECHAVEYHDEVRILSVRIDPRRFAQIREHSTAFGSSATYRSPAITRLGRLVHREFRRRDTAWALAIEALVFELVVEASRGLAEAARCKAPRWLARVEEYLHSHFSETIALEPLARLAGVHPVHLARVFRKQKGCTVGQYLREVRIEFALRQLTQTAMPLSDIAAAAGFADHSHFTRVLKARLGVTPSEYRAHSKTKLVSFQ